jgi:hypothetical protein
MYAVDRGVDVSGVYIFGITGYKVIYRVMSLCFQRLRV